MSSETRDRSSYDVVSLSRIGSEKRANYIQDALQVNKQAKTSGQFVKVFADVFLKHEVSKKSFI